MSLLVARKDVDTCTGHDACPPRKAVQGSPDVFIDGHAVVRVDDLWESHSCPAHPPHQGKVAQGSDEVSVNGLPVVRIGDPLDCGGNVKTGSETLYAGGGSTAKKEEPKQELPPPQQQPQPQQPQPQPPKQQQSQQQQQPKPQQPQQPPKPQPPKPQPQQQAPRSNAQAQNAILQKMDPGRMPRASEEAPIDRTMAQELVPLAKELGEKHGIPPALALGLASRESGFGRHLDANGYGKYDPNGFGMFQVDKGYHTPTGGPYSRAHADQAMGIYKDHLAAVQQAHPDWKPEEQMAGAIAGYNMGADDVHTRPSSAAGWVGLDNGTAGDDYSRDVWARARWFADNLDWSK